ncbi:MAG TPA: amino acid adenylation domain-containing protein, partial [Chitinophaga sp.]|uniref:non-ribosomal peptide synthetase n=1 Tax=Chitinophaga sp. TaxID=1869181 RepID=UPI002C86C69F
MLTNRLPLHPAQKDIFLDQLINIENPYYNIGGYTRIVGPLVREKFLTAVSTVPEVFDAYRMRFDIEEHTPHIYFDDNFRQLEIKELDYSQGGEEAVFSWMREQFRKPFEIKRDNVLFEHYLIKLREDEHFYFYKYHHLISDGFGVSSQNRYVARKYNTLVNNDDTQFMFSSYRDEIVKASEYYHSEEYVREGRYWKTRFDKKPQPLLQRKFHDGSYAHKRCETVVVDLTADDLSLLKELQQRTKSSLQQLTIAALMIYFGQITEQTDFVFGTPLHKRRDRKVRDIVGMFTGILPFKGEYCQDATVGELIREITALQREDYRYYNYQIGDLSRYFKINAAEENLLEIVINYAYIDFYMDFGEGLRASFYELPSGYGRYPVEIWWKDYGREQPLQLSIDYQLQYFTNDEMKLLAQRLMHILRQFMDGIDTPVQHIDIIPAAERQLMRSFNNFVVPYPHTKTLVEIFDEQAAECPDAVAVVFEGIKYTYATLLERTNRLARYLQQKGVSTDVPVPVCFNRSPDMIIGILGIMKAGGAYVPVDPQYPESRISYMLEDTHASIVVTTADIAHRFSFARHIDIVRLDADSAAIAAQPAAVPENIVRPGDLAYLIYTSGSTGKPKGVMVEHAGMLNHLYAKVNDLQITNQSVVAFTASYTFDISVWQLFSALLCGGATVIYSSQLILQPAALLQAINNDRITIWELVPSYLAALLQEQYTAPLASLQYLLVTGEAVSQPLLAQWFKHKVYGRIPVVNAYGPTEASDDICHYFMYDTPESTNVPLGRPIQNTHLYVANNMRLCPVGVTGEICVSGICVSRGYLNRPELTAEKFIDNPFDTDSRYRMYRTGDLGRWLPDGTIEYQGRVDDQVKIRGFRIELGEIETALQLCGNISQAAVLVKTDGNGNKRLVGYVVSVGTFDKEQVVAELKSRLPEYMIPTFFIELDRLPLTANGKVDRKALPDPDTAALLISTYVAPGNETERALVAIWQELLGVLRVGIYDDFFELGGDSITTIQVAGRAKRVGINLQARDIFAHQTIAALSALVINRGGAVSQAAQGMQQGVSGLLPIQQHFFEAGTAGASQYNQHLLLKIDRHIGKEKLSAAIRELLHYHDALRFSYQMHDTLTEQVYGSYAGVLDIEDLTNLAGEELPVALATCTAHYQKTLHLEDGILVRAVLFFMPQEEQHNRLLLIVHHLAVDSVSWRVLLDDIQALLQRESMVGLMEIMGDKGTSFRQWYEALHAYARETELQQQLPYWESVVQQYAPLRTDRDPSLHARTADTGGVKVKLDKAYTQQLLQQTSHVYNTEVKDLLLSALAIVISDYNDHSAVSVGLEGHGRESINSDVDISRTAGWFTSLYPVLFQVKDKNNIAQVIKHVKEQLRKVPGGGLGFGVLKYLDKAVTLQVEDPWDIVFNYLGRLDPYGNDAAVIQPLWNTFGLSIAEERPLRDKIEINAFITDGVLEILWNYSTVHFNAGRVEQLAASFISYLQAIIAHCVSGRSVSYTPADFELSDVITVEELDAFLDATRNGAPRREQLESLARLSGLQEGMLFHGLYDGQAGTYVQQFYCCLANLRTDLFVQSWQHLINRQSILRSAFYHDTFIVPVQASYREAVLPVSVLDYRHLDEVAQERAIQEYLAADRLRGFNFTSVPLMRLCLIQLHDDYYYMIWSYHHILLDGWSLPIILEELLRTYESFAAATALPIATVVRYDDYIRYLYRRNKQVDAAYWSNYLRGVEEGCLLTFISSTADRNKGDGVYEKVKLRFNATTTASLSQFTHRHHITLNTLMQGVWAYLLYRYTGKTAVTYGVIVSGRPDDLYGVEHGVGMYINTLPLHSVVDESQSLTSWLQALQLSQIECREHQYTPLNEIQRLNGIAGDLFDTLLVFENYPVSKVLNEYPWKLRLENIGLHEHTNYPLNVIIQATETVLVEFSYNSSLLLPVYANAIAGDFEQVLQQFVQVGDGLLSKIELLTDNTRSLLLETFNDTAGTYPYKHSIVEAFREQVALTPDNTAIVFETERLTYRELDERSESLAHYLVAKGVQPGTLVPVCMKRSTGLIVSILAILKAGAAYVPLDIEYPQDRIVFMLEDTAGRIAITDREFQPLFNTIAPSIALVYADSLPENITGMPLEIDSLTAESPAYVMYTSGSTGKPKGVLVSHRNVVSLVKNVTYVSLSAADILLSTGSPSFDATTFEYWGMLLNGGTLILCPEHRLLDSGLLKEEMRRHGVTKMWFTASWFNQLIDTDISIFEGLSAVLAGGEKLSDEHVNKLRRTYPALSVINGYGPTENTTFSLTFHVDDRGIIPIGRPLDNRAAYVLDVQLRL